MTFSKMMASIFLFLESFNPNNSCFRKIANPYPNTFPRFREVWLTDAFSKKVCLLGSNTQPCACQANAPKGSSSSKATPAGFDSERVWPTLTGPILLVVRCTLLHTQTWQRECNGQLCTEPLNDRF